MARRYFQTELILNDAVQKQHRGTRKITGKSESATIKLDFELPVNNSGNLIFSKNDVEKARLTETIDIDKKEMTIVAHSTQDNKADLIMRANFLSDTAVKLTLNFNGKDFIENYTFGQNEIPQCVLDLVNEIEKYNPSILIDVNHDKVLGLYSGAFNYYEGGPITINVDWRGLYCTVLIILCDIINPWLSIAGAVYNYLFVL